MESARAFQVDLHGVVDLFAHHLYSSPRVYLRELLQNGVDAITARRLGEPSCPARVRLSQIPGGGLQVSDTGIGLTNDQATELLATIGHSSKRMDDLEIARSDYLGQFGIGLLSAFMVADEIEMLSLSAGTPGAAPIRWRGFADGTYTLDDITLDEYAQATGGVEPGSLVRLSPRRDEEHWLAPDTVRALATDFGSLLPLDIAIQVLLDDGTALWQRITEPDLPWAVKYSSPAERDAAMDNYCARILGFRPLACFDLSVPLVGLTGIAFVLPTAASPAGMNTHRAYLKRMLVGTQVPGLLPPWAFFVRCVINSSELRPTASREALYEDDVLLATREALGRAVRDWVAAVLSDESQLRNAFVRTHHLAIRSMSLHDDDMLDLAASVLPYETTLGTMTLEEFHEEQDTVLYAATVEDFRRVAPVARAQGLGVVNAGYVYDADLLGRLAARRPSWSVRLLEASDVESTLTPLTPEEELKCLDFLLESGEPASELDCEIWLRRFEPEALPAMLITDSDIEHQRSLQRTRDESTGVWGGVLDDFAKPSAKRRLVLNYDNQTVQTLATGGDAEVHKAGIQTLYVTAQLLAGEPLRPRDAKVMNEALAMLLHRAVGGPRWDEQT
ncbi:MAG: HSP90 family protein [Propionibacteriaceae bacterium]|nr:HSP90 family protein [Propionibacteriaceae bacterium]